MHEWALAEAVVRTADEFAEEKKLKEITEIQIELGKLQQISIPTFETAMREGTYLGSKVTKDTKFIISQKDAVLKCRNCDEKWSPDKIKEGLGKDISEAIHFIPEMAHAYIKCPKCGSHDFKVAEGRGVSVVSIKGLQDD
ncbi:hydrogenase nickel incorporation protein HypA [Candidatus Undinarchaeota archaeon]